MKLISHKTWKPSSYLVLLIGLVVLLGLYSLLRYGGWWSELDTSTFIRYTYSIISDAKLIPAGSVYNNGYGYQVLMAWLAAFTGMPIGALQVAGGALLVVWVVAPAWLAYRELTRSSLAASLASLILFIQPEFLFPILRGTHEKFTRGLMFLCIYLLVRSLRTKSVREVAFLTASFYLCSYALLSFNNFLASSFILGTILALGLIWAWQKRDKPDAEAGTNLVSKLFMVSASMLVVAFLFTFYAYPPAAYQLGILHYFIDRLALLTLNAEAAATNPYQWINNGWVSRPAYCLVSLANWLLLALSLMVWAKQSYQWLIRRKERPQQHETLLWAFYLAFGFLGVVGILLDISGALSSNLQLRVYPTFAMVAAPLIAMWLLQLKPERTRLRKGAWAGASVAMGCLMVLSMIKATNEPVLSNYWIFYTPAEYQATAWAESSLPQQDLNVGDDARIAFGYFIRQNGRPVNINFISNNSSISASDYLISEANLLFSQRVGSQLRITPDSLITYDNGTAQIYHRRPVTPYQK